ncbi:hypothetical protein HER21_18120 [Pseudomonas sp. BGM005]|jgi:hypothetical protein|nr:MULTISPECIES: hypothetical protein [Pseudomonas]NKF28377.1 hypothetical protein [Pseudomonas sp. BG5]
MQAITARMNRYRNKVEGRTGTPWESRFIRTFASWIQDLPMPYGVNATSRRDTPPSNELQLTSAALQRVQLTGNLKFVDEIEKITGRRILFREQGRPEKIT